MEVSGADPKVGESLILLGFEATILPPFLPLSFETWLTL